jgi:Pentapeptide repeats (8 copies)
VRNRRARLNKWREEQRRETAKDLRNRFTIAAGQLADENPAIRRAGAYVIVALADDWRAFGNDAEHQVCIDMLTGYLTSANPTYVGTSETTPATAGEDGTTRATIVRLLAAHRAASDEARRTPTNYAVSGADLRAKYAVSGADLRAVSLRYADLRQVDLSGVKPGRRKAARC